MKPSEIFGTIQESFIYAWREHLGTHEYSAHKTLEDYYESIPDLTDELIECWQSEHELIDDYQSLLNQSEFRGKPIEYLEALKKLVSQAREELFEGSDELCSIADEILSLISNTIYGLRHLTENKKPGRLADYL